MRVVIAPDSFKGTVEATDVAAALARGWARARPGDELVEMPMADGGEGTLDAFLAAVPGATRVPVEVLGPDSRLVPSNWVLLPDGTGVVELASTSGITMLDPLQPLDAHTVGFGEAIAAALDHGVERLLLGLGGSATTDGGAGALAALGARFADPAGEPVRPGNRGLADLAAVDLGSLRALPPGGAVVLGDVTNPLLGPTGAAAVFGPQKGADAATVEFLEANLARLAGLVDADAGAPGTGAAGGTGFAMLAWGARLGGGAELIARTIGLPGALADADLVITGEGRYDGQSEAGKAPTEVACLAEQAGVPVALVAGAITAEPARFAASVSLTELAGGAAGAMADGVRWLEEAGARLARDLP
ncbi:glycerate kinase [Agromyces salentinus]|uniref:Glycerate kinase n=1 Tax=Agromyces salentinus TaxID=269421 RepID=A0ABN2ME62_9MICO|nr:glycerate kinase [Agromyces salentinus]